MVSYSVTMKSHNTDECGYGWILNQLFNCFVHFICDNRHDMPLVAEFFAYFLLRKIYGYSTRVLLSINLMATEPVGVMYELPHSAAPSSESNKSGY